MFVFISVLIRLMNNQPVTSVALRKFHRSGTPQRSNPEGLRRVQELLAMSVNIRTPVTHIILQNSKTTLDKT